MGCEDLSEPCPSCREFMEAVTSYNLVERVERLEAWVRRREESERVEQAIREYGV